MRRSLSQQLTEALSSPQTAKERHLETLIQVSRSIGTILDTQKLVVAIMEQVTRAFESDRSTLFIYDREKHVLWSRFAQGQSPDGHQVQIQIKDTKGLAGHVFQTHESLNILDTFEDERFAREVAEKTGYVPRSMLVVPVTNRGGRCDGVLQVMDSRVNYFTDDDVALAEAIAVQVAISLDNARLYEAQQRQFISFVRAFSEALDARDPITRIHSINVANYAVGIAYNLGMSTTEMDWLHVAGLLHDVGKIGTPEDILTKPGKLTDEEYGIMKQHAAHSRRILQQIEFTEQYQGMAHVASAHHERLDGTGYPDGLIGPEMNMRARILAVADVFDALTQDRHYRPGMSLEKALSILDSMTPNQLDERCVKALRWFMGVRVSGMAA